MINYSIVIPSYNNKGGLDVCLKSLIGMRCPENLQYEIIVVDDGSDDGTYEYLKSVWPQVKSIYLPRDEKSSRSRARNAGANEAKGKIINFLDSDIVVLSDHIVEMDRYFSRVDNLVLVGTRAFHEKYDPTLLVQESAELDFRHQIYLAQSFNVGMLDYPWVITYSCNLSINRKCFLELGGFDENFIDWGLEDVDLGYRCHTNGQIICNNPYLNVAHMGSDSRSEILTESERLRGYTRNIDYFIHKHDLTSIYPNDNLYSLLTDGNDLCRDLLSLTDEKVKVIINSSGGAGMEATLEELLLHYHQIVIFDFEKKSNLDLWAQLHSCSKRIFYFPFFIIEEKDRSNLYFRAKYKEDEIQRARLERA